MFITEALASVCPVTSVPSESEEVAVAVLAAIAPTLRPPPAVVLPFFAPAEDTHARSRDESHGCEAAISN